MYGVWPQRLQLWLRAHRGQRATLRLHPPRLLSNWHWHNQCNCSWGCVTRIASMPNVHIHTHKEQPASWGNTLLLYSTHTRTLQWITQPSICIPQTSCWHSTRGKQSRGSEWACRPGSRGVQGWWVFRRNPRPTLFLYAAVLCPSHCSLSLSLSLSPHGLLVNRMTSLLSSRAECRAVELNAMHSSWRSFLLQLYSNTYFQVWNQSTILQMLLFVSLKYIFIHMACKVGQNG